MIKKILFICIMFFTLSLLGGCSSNPDKDLEGISFNDIEVEYNGSQHQVLLSGELPKGYSVEYSQNNGVEAGDYYAVANVKNSFGKVVKTYRAVLTVSNPVNTEFEEYLDSFFVKYLEDDQLSVNIFCENPEDFGLSHYDAEWYSYTRSTDEELAEGKAELQELLTELECYKDARLSTNQKIAYNQIKTFLNENIALYEVDDIEYMRVVYVDQFGGYVADFSTYLEAYSLRSEQEIKDVVSYINSTAVAFPSYLDFVADKAEAGYALSNFTIKNMRSYLKDIIDQGEEYYLADTLCDRVDAVSFINDSDKEKYKEEIKNAMTNSYFPAVQELYDGLASYLNKLSSSKEGYWSKYANGKELYINELQGLLGIENINMDEYIKELEKALKEANRTASSKVNTIANTYGISTYDELYDILEKNIIYDGTPEEMIVYLKEFAKTIVPDLKSEPNIVVKEMDLASAKVSNAVAYYMKSALDNTGSENITLNPEKVGNKNDVLGTMAHEGYPGHLYAYVYSKESGIHNVSKIMTSTAHAEGWATYVELKLYDYAIEKATDPGMVEIIEYYKANHLAGFLLETIIDARIHYSGWNTMDISNYLSKLGYDASAAFEIYNLLIEIPTQYAAYGYGKYFFVKLHDEAKELLGEHYNEVEFNAMLLSRGWTSLGELQNTYNEYMKAKCHKYGINFTA